MGGLLARFTQVQLPPAGEDGKRADLDLTVITSGGPTTLRGGVRAVAAGEAAANPTAGLTSTFAVDAGQLRFRVDPRTFPTRPNRVLLRYRTAGMQTDWVDVPGTGTSDAAGEHALFTLPAPAATATSGEAEVDLQVQPVPGQDAQRVTLTGGRTFAWYKGSLPQPKLAAVSEAVQFTHELKTASVVGVELTTDGPGLSSTRLYELAFPGLWASIGSGTARLVVKRAGVHERRLSLGGPPVEHQDEPARVPPPQVPEHGQHRRGVDVLRPDVEQQPDPPAGRGHGQGRQHAPPAAAVPGAGHRGLALRRPRPPHRRLEHEPGLVDRDDRLARRGRLFFSRGRVTRRNRATAAGSCSRATRPGFWAPHLARRSRCHTPDGSYETPNALRTRAATRPSVHRSLAYPWAGAPRASRVRSTVTWSSPSFGAGPGCGLAARAAGPPASYRCRHVVTDPGDAPTIRATSQTPRPSRSNSAARRRRRANSSAVPCGLIRDVRPTPRLCLAVQSSIGTNIACPLEVRYMDVAITRNPVRPKRIGQ